MGSTITVVVDPANSGALLEVMAYKVAPYFGGTWFTWLILIDAVVILCATVLTTYVGVTGLLVTMTKDGMLENACSAPAFLTTC